MIIACAPFRVEAARASIRVPDLRRRTHRRQFHDVKAAGEICPVPRAFEKRKATPDFFDHRGLQIRVERLVVERRQDQGCQTRELFRRRAERANGQHHAIAAHAFFQLMMRIAHQPRARVDASGQKRSE